jgi:putative nucleotidyltransferase with HDIG domain
MNSTHFVIPIELKNVPPFPPVAAKLLTLLSNPDVEVSEVAEVISNDVKLTARLLQSINSSLFGLGRPVSNVHQAIALLGFDRTRQIAVMNATAAYAKGAVSTKELQSCWQHSVATAILAEEIGKSCEVFTKAAFTVGLLHDIGRLGLILAYPQEYEQIIRGATERCLDVLDFEREEFGIDHAEAGRILAETWDLPEEFHVIAGRHHDPCEGVELDLLRIVHVGCRLADVLGYGIVPPETGGSVGAVLEELPPHARRRLLKDPEELRSQIETRISSVVGSLG